VKKVIIKCLKRTRNDQKGLKKASIKDQNPKNGLVKEQKLENYKVINKSRWKKTLTYIRNRAETAQKVEIRFKYGSY
jgi:hypothetical protein